MSRVGKKPIPIPDKVEVKVEGNVVTVKGPKGTLTRPCHPDMDIKVEDGQLIVERPSDEKRHRALHGLTRSLLDNMVVGVTEGFKKTLELSGVGYRAVLQGKKLVISLGYSHPIEIEPEEGTEFEVPAVNKIVVKGIDKEVVGRVAAKMRALRDPDPYNVKGVKYEGEHIRRKVGKTG